MDEMNWTIETSDNGQRLDLFLRGQCPELSRSRIQQLIETGAVLVNDQPAKNNTKIKTDDVILLQQPEEQELPVEAQAMDLDIVYEDADIIVINKPKGLVVHPAPGHPDHTLVNGLLAHCTDLSGINGVKRPGIVHRLDQMTSGLIAACKNDAAHAALAAQLADKSMNREYIALVHGNIPHERGTIDAPIGRDERNRQKMAVTAKNSRPAVTHFQVIERLEGYTLVRCRLETGRTHQIRVHLQYIGFPVVGDPKYSLKNTLDTDGQMLHATQLRFIHPQSHQEMTFQASLPDAFEAVLAQLRQGGI